MHEILTADDKFSFPLILHVRDRAHDNPPPLGRGNVSAKVGFCCVN